jgi:hypothetical protein
MRSPRWLVRAVGLAVPLSLTAGAVSGCTASSEGTDSSDLALVTDIQCSIARGAFVVAPANGQGVAGSCPGARDLALNGEPLAASGGAFTMKPREGVNILHVERGQGADARATDIPFLFGSFGDPRALVPNAIAIRANASGISQNGALGLPLPATPSRLTLTQIGTQFLRDQGNLLSRLDGIGSDVSGLGFRASVKLLHPSYESRNLSVIVTPSARGLHVDASIRGARATIAWDAGVNVFSIGDEIAASIEEIRVSAEVNLVFDRQTRKIQGSLGAHTIKVDGLELDSTGLSKIPLGIGDGLESAIATGAEALVNLLADPVLERVKDRLVPFLGVTVEQFRLPSRLDLPALSVPGGPPATLEIGQSFDGASFDRTGFELALAARVSAPNPNPIPAPGYLVRPTKPASFEAARDQDYGVSLSVDYANQALFAGWKQGLLNRQVSGPINQLGISTDAIVAEAKLPPVVFAHPAGGGLQVNLGELHLTTVFHSPTLGDARVKFAVSLLAGANLKLGKGGEVLIVEPNQDDARTKFVAELIGVDPGHAGAAAELAAILTQFAPVVEAIIAHDLALPPIAVPAVDLGGLTPGFRGKKARLDGALVFDPTASRVGAAGKLIAQ